MTDDKIISLLSEMKSNCEKPTATDPKRMDKAEALNYAIWLIQHQKEALNCVPATDWTGSVYAGVCPHCGQGVILRK